MPATPKTKEEIEQELYELTVVATVAYREDMDQFDETTWNELYPKCSYSTAVQYFNKWMRKNPEGADTMDVLIKLGGSSLNGALDDIKNEVHNIPEPEPETVYVVREEPVMSKLNLILSSC